MTTLFGVTSIGDDSNNDSEVRNQQRDDVGGTMYNVRSSFCKM
jgi:hypothetical protein